MKLPSILPGSRARSAALLRAALCAAGGALLLAACAVGPDYRRPELDLPAAFKEAPAGWKSAEPADLAARGAWWRRFGDPALDGLMAQLHDANQNLRVAEANWRSAAALGRQARAALFPTVGAQASGSRGGSQGVVANSVQAGLSVDWEADLWGRLRRQSESQEASAQASLADLANTRLSLEAELATDYFALRVADAQRALYDANVASYEASLRLTRNRLAAGVVTPADVAQAETQWLSARAQAVDADIDRAQLEHAIAVLVGRAPAGFSLAALPAAEGQPGQLAFALPAVPAELPASLLERRPDVASAERQAAAANASIGVARAALFPTLTLSASGGYQGSSAANLFDVAHRFWTLGPAALALTLFDAGARRAQIDQAEAAYDAAAASYRQTVLAALQDVEDQLVALRVLEGEADLQAQTVRAAGVSLQLALNQYRAGTVGYLDVVSAQATDQSARLSALSIRGRQFAATVALVKALGGGWSAAEAGLPGAQAEAKAD